ncbi:MAG: DinB family protein [Planctomycetota bacterium]
MQIGDQANVMRQHVLTLLEGGHTYSHADDVLAGWDASRVGERVAGHSHTAWRLVWHLWFTQGDLLRFAMRDDYKEPEWPAAYWPDGDGPADAFAWDRTVAEFRDGLATAQQLAAGTVETLLQVAPRGDGSQTVLRSLLMIAEHNAYHLGQLQALKWSLAM